MRALLSAGGEALAGLYVDAKAQDARRSRGLLAHGLAVGRRRNARLRPRGTGGKNRCQCYDGRHLRTLHDPPETSPMSIMAVMSAQI